GRVIRADHERAPLPRDRVLRHHPDAGLDVALRVVEERLARGPFVLGGDAVDAGRDVEIDHAVGTDEVESELGIRLVRLPVVRQAHSRELGLAALGADPLDGELRESPGERRILPAGDAEHEPTRARRAQVVDEEADTPRDLTGGVDLRLRTERLDDLALQFPHGRILSSGEVPAYAADVTDGWRASVGAEVERGTLRGDVDRLVESLVGRGVLLDRAEDLPGHARLEPTDELARRSADESLRRVLLQARARVGDVEVAHRELPDAVVRSEGGVAHPLHRELLGRVAEVRTGGVEERVVVAATQPQRHLARDGRADPALQRFAQHERLRVEPAPLVHEATESATLGVVV